MPRNRPGKGGKTWLQREIEEAYGQRIEAILLNRRYRRGWSIWQIANELECSPGTVMKWISSFDMNYRQSAAKYWQERTPQTMTDDQELTREAAAS